MLNYCSILWGPESTMTMDSASCTVLSFCSVLIHGAVYLVFELMSFLFPLFFVFVSVYVRVCRVGPVCVCVCL